MTPALPSRHSMPSAVGLFRLLAALVALFALYQGRTLLAPLCLAGFVALALNPVVARLSRLMPRSLAAAVVVAGALAALGGAAYALSDDAARAIEGLPKAARQFRQTLQRSTAGASGPLADIDRAIGELQRLWRSAPSDGTPDLRRELLAAGTRSLDAGTRAVALVFLVYFLLATGDSLKAKLVRLNGARLERRHITVQAIDEVTAQMARFVVYLVASGTLVGVTTWLAFRWMGLAYPSLWGLAAGVLNAVPYLGPTVVMLGSGLAAAVQFQSLGPAASIAGVSLAITSLEGLVLNPILVGRLARVHPVVVFLSIVFWGWMWGPIGTFLAVPIVTALKAIADLLPEADALSQVLAGEEAVPRFRSPVTGIPRRAS